MHLRFILILLAFALPAFAQNRPQQTPTILMGPSDWRFEHLPIPPGFARDIKWKGFEEARFSPGMFVTNSDMYFTYTLVVTLDDAPEMGAPEVKEFLDKYFRGLSSALGQRKQIKADYSEVKAEVKPPKDAPDARNRFEATLPYFDTFHDGQKITLNIDVGVVPKTPSGKTYLTLLISSKPRNAEVWTKLRATIEKLKLEEK